MAYTILIDHTSSNSFNSERRQTELPVIWASLDAAKAALARIKELYRIDCMVEDYSSKYTVKEAARLRQVAAFLPDEESKYDTIRMCLALDDGTEQSIATFWRGWGERLHCATIVETEDAEMRFCPEELPYDWYKA